MRENLRQASGDNLRLSGGKIVFHARERKCPGGGVDDPVRCPRITVAAGPTSVVGHAVILHANPDDLTTQPSGNAGPRIACGIAEAMAGEMHH